MNKLLTLTTLLLIIISCNTEPTQFTINGTIDTSTPIEEVTLQLEQDTATLASAKVVDGKFTLTGVANEPSLAILYFGNKGARTKMVLENADFEVVFKDDGKYVKGGKLNEELFGYAHTSEFIEAEKTFYKKYHEIYKNVEKGDLKALEIAYKKLAPYQAATDKIRSERCKNIIEGETSTLAKVFALSLYYHENYTHERKIELLNQYEKDLPNNKFLTSFRSSLQKSIALSKKQMAATKVGVSYIDFSATTIDGQELVLSEVVSKNKYTLVEFWASWCSPCRGSFPHLKEKYAEYKDKGFEIYGLSLDTKEKAFLKASDEENLPWINAVDYAGFDGQAAQDYAVTGIPYTVLIGQNGKIVGAGNDIRGLALDGKLKELFGE